MIYILLIFNKKRSPYFRAREAFMDLAEILPRDGNLEAENFVQEFVRNIIVRVNFVPALRYHLGWRGLKEVADGPEAWTMKIAGYQGVFGLMLHEARDITAIETSNAESHNTNVINNTKETIESPKHPERSIDGECLVYYFPHPDEELVDFFSVAAGVIAQQGDYHERVRHFSHYHDLLTYFHVGALRVQVRTYSSNDTDSDNTSPQGPMFFSANEGSEPDSRENRDGNSNWSNITLSVHSLNHLKVYREDGVIVTTQDGPRQVVEAGGLEQDIPGWQLSSALFEVMAGSLSLLAGAAPTALLETKKQGKAKRMRLEAEKNENPDDKISGNKSGLPVVAQEAEPGIQHNNLSLSWRNIQEFSEFSKIDQNGHDPETEEQEIVLQWTNQDKTSPLPYEKARWWQAHRLQDATSLDKKALGVDDRPELIVLSGFLGSGKTSFLQNFIEYQQQYNRFVAVLQNEIGEKSLDSKLLESSYSVLDIEEGCVCCSLVGSLKSGINQILEQFQPDYIVLETTGVANPKNLLDELVEVEEQVRFDSVTTLVDAGNMRKSLAEYQVAREQLEAADIVVLNKTENMASQEVDELKEELRTVQPTAPIVATSYGDINPAVLYSGEGRTDYSGLSQGHSHNHDEDGLHTIQIDLPEPLTEAQLEKALTSLPEDIFRVKGLVQLLPGKDWVVVQGVGGRMDVATYSGQGQQGSLTLIGRHLQNFDILAWKDGFAQGGSAPSLQDFVVNIAH